MGQITAIEAERRARQRRCTCGVLCLIVIVIPPAPHWAFQAAPQLFSLRINDIREAFAARSPVTDRRTYIPFVKLGPCRLGWGCGVSDAPIPRGGVRVSGAARCGRPPLPACVTQCGDRQASERLVDQCSAPAHMRSRQSLVTASPVPDTTYLLSVNNYDCVVHEDLT